MADEDGWEERMGARARVRREKQAAADRAQRKAEADRAEAEWIAAHAEEHDRLAAEGVDYCRVCWYLVNSPDYLCYGRFTWTWVHGHTDDGCPIVQEPWRDHDYYGVGDDPWITTDPTVDVCRHSCHGPVGYVLPPLVAIG